MGEEEQASAAPETPPAVETTEPEKSEAPAEAVPAPVVTEPAVEDTPAAGTPGAVVAADAEKAEAVAENVLDHAGNFASTVEGEISNAKVGLEKLQTSSNAGAIGTIVNDVIQHWQGVVTSLETALGIFKANTGK